MPKETLTPESMSPEFKRKVRAKRLNYDEVSDFLKYVEDAANKQRSLKQQAEELFDSYFKYK